MNGLEWIAGIREMDAAKSRSVQWVLSRAQGVPPDAHLEPSDYCATTTGIVCDLLRE